MNNPELFDIHLWIAATPQRQREIVDAVLALLPSFEFVTLRTYAGPGQNKLIPTATFRQRGSGILFNLIPGGTFQMGFSEEESKSLQTAIKEAGLEGEEAGYVEDFLSEPASVNKATLLPFLFARFPLRLTEAACILEVDPHSEDAPYMLEAEYDFASGRDFDMATFLEEDVDNFLAKSGYLLPSEAQWEYTCRATSTTPFWWGEKLPDGSEWTTDLDNAAETDRCSNGFGLVNMAAYPELCADTYNDSCENPPDDGSAEIAEETEDGRVTRGGAAFSYPWQGVAEWLGMLSCARFGDMNIVIRPVYPVSLFDPLAGTALQNADGKG